MRKIFSPDPEEIMVRSKRGLFLMEYKGELYWHEEQVKHLCRELAKFYLIVFASLLLMLLAGVVFLLAA